MAATAVRNTTAPSQYPMVSREIDEQIAAERRRLRSTPEMNPNPADISRSEKFVFRSQPGRYRQLFHNIPVIPEESSFKTDAKWEFAKRVWKRLVAEPMRAEDETRDQAAVRVGAYFADLVERVGSPMIVFTRIPRHMECIYATNDEVVATYIRGLIEAKYEQFAFVHEASGKSRVVVGFGTDKVMAFPDTGIGWNLARSYASEHGIEDIKLVKE